MGSSAMFGKIRSIRTIATGHAIAVNRSQAEMRTTSLYWNPIRAIAAKMLLKLGRS